jgi:hypothetical protein
MARIRYLKPEFFSDEDLAELPFQTRLTFAGLWCYADKAGRLEDRPKYLKAMIFPYDNVDMDKQLESLSKGKHENGIPFIQRYEIEGIKFIQIIRWDKHQKPHHTEKESNFPPAPPLKIKIMGMGKQLEASGELDNGELTVKRPLSKLSDDEFLQSLKEKFTWVDFEKEMVKIDAWLMANPGRQKTRKFIVKWISKIEKPLIVGVPLSITKEKDSSPSWIKDAVKEGWK